MAATQTMPAGDTLGDRSLWAAVAAADLLMLSEEMGPLDVGTAVGKAAALCHKAVVHAAGLAAQEHQLSSCLPELVEVTAETGNGTARWDELLVLLCDRLAASVDVARQIVDGAQSGEQVDCGEEELTAIANELLAMESLPPTQAVVYA